MKETSYIAQGSEASMRLDKYHAHGPYSDIYKRSDCAIAVKLLRCVPTDQTHIDKVIQMLNDVLVPVWSQLAHERIVPLLGFHASPPKYELPYYRKGNIVDHNRHYPDTNKLHQIVQIAEGINYLHKMDAFHGNICPTNILINDEGEVCISDPAFNILMYQLTYDTHAPTPGTWCYKSPEELLDATHTGPKADVYSWASVAYEVFSGRRPYHGYQHGRGIVKIIDHGHRALARPSEITPRLWSIMQECWMVNPEDRPTMGQVESELRGL